MNDERTYAVCGECLGRLVPTDDQHECQVLRAHSVLGTDFPALAAVWESDDEDAAPSTDEGEARMLTTEQVADQVFAGEPWTFNGMVEFLREREAAIRAPLEERIRELEDNLRFTFNELNESEAENE